MSSFPIHDITALWPLRRTASRHRLDSSGLAASRGQSLRSDDSEAALEVGFRFAAVQVGYWVGWAAIGVVLAGLALDVGARDRLALVVLTLAAAACNTVAMIIPWREWLATRRGRVLLDLWCGGLIAFVALLVVDAGSSFSLLLFLAVPFITVVQIGWRRGLWLAVATGTCSVIAAVMSLSAGATAMRLALIAVTAGVALLLAHVIRREAVAHARAAARVELERALAREASHRIKNDLQTAADLLLLGRRDAEDATAFDETAARIRSIATVHRLLSEGEAAIDGAALLHSIASAAPAPVRVEAEPTALDATTAQRLGIIANELVTNAFKHGSAPIVVRLRSGETMWLSVEDGGSRAGGEPGLGLDLVRRLVEQGLGGRFELLSPAAGGTRADVVFPAVSR